MDDQDPLIFILFKFWDLPLVIDSWPSDYMGYMPRQRYSQR